MSNSTQHKKNLVWRDIGNNRMLAIDPHNVFWGITPGRQDAYPLASKKITSLYEGVKKRLDLQMQEFRFSSNLTAVYIDPTDRCNAHCPYCYVPADLRKSGAQMNEVQLDYVLRKIAKYFKAKKTNTLPVIVFHASEPLLVKDIIFKAIRDFRSQFHFGIQTNALLLEEADVEFLKKHRVCVGISLDSFDPRINKRLRPAQEGIPSFDKAVQAMEWFANYDGLNVIATITKFNVGHLPEFVKFLHSKKVGCVLLNPVRLTSKASLNLAPEKGLLSKYFIAAVEKAMELSRFSRDKIIIGNFVNIVLAIVAPPARRLMCDISPCGGGRCFLTITASGRMIPCGEFIGLDGFSGGNIFDTTISKAMQSKPFKKIRARIVEEVGECDVCDFRNICGAPCPAELYSLGRNMYRPSVFCEFYKEIITFAFKLIAEDKIKYLLGDGKRGRFYFLKSGGSEYEYNL